MTHKVRFVFNVKGSESLQEVIDLLKKEREGVEVLAVLTETHQIMVEYPITDEEKANFDEWKKTAVTTTTILN